MMTALLCTVGVIVAIVGIFMGKIVVCCIGLLMIVAGLLFYGRSGKTHGSVHHREKPNIRACGRQKFPPW